MFMGFEEMLNEESPCLDKFKVGVKLDATVTQLRGKEVAFVVDDYFCGSISLSEFYNKPEVGDLIPVFLETFDDGFGNSIYYHRKGLVEEKLDSMSDAIDACECVSAEVVSVSKSGLNLLIDGYVDAFMPKKQVSIEYISDFEHLVGTFIDGKILSFDPVHGNLILSRKEKIRDEEGVFTSLDYGVVYDCIVTSIARFGLFVDIGGLTGLIHVSDLSWDLSAANLSSFNRGDKIKAMAKHVCFDERGNERFYLSIKHLDNSPWENAKSSLAIGSTHDFTIFKIETDTGSIVGGVGGVGGVISSKELGWTGVLLSKFNIGDIIPVTIDSMDNKLGFETVMVSHRNTQENPWVEINEKFKVGDIIDTVITEIYDGEMLFVRLVGDVDAIVYPLDVDITSPYEKMSEYAVGDSVRVKLTQISSSKKRLIASIKDAIDVDNRDS